VVKLSTGLSAALAATALLLGSGGHAQAVRPIAEAAEAQFRTCLAVDPATPAPKDPGGAAPPGLARAASVIVWQIPTDRGRLYAYRDRGKGEVVCGLAVYDVDPGPIAASSTIRRPTTGYRPPAPAASAISARSGRPACRARCSSNGRPRPTRRALKPTSTRC
jgi:hypothetical protein